MPPTPALASRNAAPGPESHAEMLHARPASTTTLAPPRSLGGSQRPVAGGDAWIVPHEPGGFAWISASAPEIRIVDRRPRVATSAAR